MLLYRVFPYLPSARPDQPGHPCYVNPHQGAGRFDNPTQYLAWYMAAEAATAVGESFADITTWSESMFAFPLIPGARRALGIFEVDDGLPYVDLDDPQRLVELGVRPSQVIERNLPYTQSLAARIYEEHRYHGIRWWSFHQPQWRVWCLWEVSPTAVQIDPLSVSHPAVVDAARTLIKPIPQRRNSAANDPGSP